MKSPKPLLQGDEKAKAKIVPLRLPADLVAAVNALAQASSPPLPASAAMRLLLRAGLASHRSVPFDLGGAAFSEGYLAGHAQAVEAHQRALHAAKEKLAGRAA